MKDPYAIGQLFGKLAFYAVVIYLVFRWFKKRKK